MSPSQHQALITLMNRQYGEIREIELAHGIFGEEGDFRPRIEYYHDAVRAFSSGQGKGGKHGRLSVERLAYDVAMLRHIQTKPLVAGRGKQHLSPGTALTVSGVSGTGGEPDRETRSQLKQLYKDYTVLFVALLAEKAGRDAKDRIEEMNTSISDLAMLQDMMAKMAKGEITQEALMAMVEQVEHDELRRKMKALLSQRGMKASELSGAQAQMKQASQGIDQEIAAIDKAALNFSTGQLAVYEEARDTVKRLAASGMNVAGKFVESAMAQTAAKSRGR